MTSYLSPYYNDWFNASFVATCQGDTTASTSSATGDNDWFNASFVAACQGDTAASISSATGDTRDLGHLKTAHPTKYKRQRILEPNNETGKIISLKHDFNVQCIAVLKSCYGGNNDRKNSNTRTLLSPLRSPSSKNAAVSTAPSPPTDSSFEGRKRQRIGTKTGITYTSHKEDDESFEELILEDYKVGNYGQGNVTNGRIPVESRPLCKGTLAPYQPQACYHEDESRIITLHSITAMQQHADNSYEELRLGDYRKGNRGRIPVESRPLCKGTLAPYQPQACYHEDESRIITLHSITAMQQHADNSYEELRLGDYRKGNRGRIPVESRPLCKGTFAPYQPQAYYHEDESNSTVDENVSKEVSEGKTECPVDDKPDTSTSPSSGNTLCVSFLKNTTPMGLSHVGEQPRASNNTDDNKIADGSQAIEGDNESTKQKNTSLKGTVESAKDHTQTTVQQYQATSNSNANEYTIDVLESIGNDHDVLFACQTTGKVDVILRKHKESKRYSLVVRDKVTGKVKVIGSINHGMPLEKLIVEADPKNKNSEPTYIINFTTINEYGKPGKNRIVCSEAKNYEKLYDVLAVAGSNYSLNDIVIVRISNFNTVDAKILKTNQDNTYDVEDIGSRRKQKKFVVFWEQILGYKQSKLMQLPTMVEGVLGNDHAVQSDCATQISQLFETEIHSPIQNVIDANVIPRFVEFLQQDYDPWLQYEATSILGEIVAGTSEHTKIVTEAGAVPILVRLLSRSAIELVRRMALWVLGNIASESPPCRDLVLQAGVMTPLLQQLNSKSIFMLQTATWLLCVLSKFDRKKPSRAIRPSLPTLLFLIHNQDDEEVLTNVCTALFRMMRDGKDEESIDAVKKGDVYGRLVELLLNPSVAVQFAALQTVWFIVEGNSLQRQCIIDYDAIPRLFGRLFGSEKHIIEETNRKIGEQSLRCITGACHKLHIHNSKQIKILVQQGYIRSLFELLAANVVDPKSVTHSIDSLQNIFQVGEEKSKATGQWNVIELKLNRLFEELKAGFGESVTNRLGFITADDKIFVPFPKEKGNNEILDLSILENEEPSADSSNSITETSIASKGMTTLTAVTFQENINENNDVTEVGDNNSWQYVIDKMDNNKLF